MYTTNLDEHMARVRDGKLRQRVHKVGIELEGGWNTLPRGTQLQRDTSVRFGTMEAPPNAARRPGTRNENGDAWVRFNPDPSEPVPPFSGELPSHILGVAQFPDWVRTYYPSQVNATCGLHIHMSFAKVLYYQQLMVKEYQDSIVKYMIRWANDERLLADHCIWPRLRGQVEYCQHKFWPDHQARVTNKDYDHFREGCRYTVMNYCYGRLRTLECRLLPMFQDKEQSIRALTEILNITNAFLVANKGREERHYAKVPLEGDILREEIIECV